MSLVLIYEFTSVMAQTPPGLVADICLPQPHWIPLNPIKWDINSFCMLLRLANIFASNFISLKNNMYGKPHFEIYTALMAINLPMANFMVLLRVGRQISRSSSATINTEFLSSQSTIFSFFKKYHFHHHERWKKLIVKCQNSSFSGIISSQGMLVHSPQLNFFINLSLKMKKTFSSQYIVLGKIFHRPRWFEIMVSVEN